mmetsp:Transcript_15762/g.34102  ORF Transcript_15762/g.34102 Transcript_15762/m.34102 type:complete len:153 (+) Transcript_15762:2059-2517(+)
MTRSSGDRIAKTTQSTARDEHEASSQRVVCWSSPDFKSALLSYLALLLHAFFAMFDCAAAAAANGAFGGGAVVVREAVETEEESEVGGVACNADEESRQASARMVRFGGLDEVRHAECERRDELHDLDGRDGTPKNGRHTHAEHAGCKVRVH